MGKSNEVQTRLDRIDTGVQSAFSKVKQELDMHCDSINQNSSELSAAYQYIAALEAKIEKIGQRVDELSFTKSNDSIDLSVREQEIFLVLYMAPDAMSCSDIGKYLGLTEEFVSSYIAKLIAKHIPISKEAGPDGVVSYMLDQSFKQLQSEKNVIQLHDSVISQVNPSYYNI